MDSYPITTTTSGRSQIGIGDREEFTLILGLAHSPRFKAISKPHGPEDTQANRVGPGSMCAVAINGNLGGRRSLESRCMGLAWETRDAVSSARRNPRPTGTTILVRGSLRR
jgi:hypothetical protein